MLDALQRAKSDVQGAVKNLQAMQATVERVISPNNGALLVYYSLFVKIIDRTRTSSEAIRKPVSFLLQRIGKYLCLPEYQALLLHFAVP